MTDPNGSALRIVSNRANSLGLLSRIIQGNLFLGFSLSPLRLQTTDSRVSFQLLFTKSPSGCSFLAFFDWLMNFCILPSFPSEKINSRFLRILLDYFTDLSLQFISTVAFSLPSSQLVNLLQNGRTHIRSIKKRLNL